jgi:hypothetical protein
MSVTDTALPHGKELTRNATPEIECDYCMVTIPYPVPIFRAYRRHEGDVYEGPGYAMTTLCMECAQEDEYFSGSVKNCGVKSRFCKSCQRPVAFGGWHKTIREFCSRTCYDRHKGHRTETISCQTCNESFTPKRTDSKYCSSKCRQKAYRQRST